MLKKLGQFQFLHISLLREYLDLEFRNDAMSFGYSLERVIDDFVVLCFLVGNDFMPHLPTLDIGEGGLDSLFALYRERLPSMGGYIVDNGGINSHRLEQIFVALGAEEESVFKQRIADEADFQKRQSKFKKKDNAREIAFEEAEEYSEENAKARFDAELKALQEEKVDTHFEPGTGKFKQLYYKEKFPEFFEVFVDLMMHTF